MTRPLGATLVEVFMSIRQFQVLGCCKHDNPSLGGYIYGIFSFFTGDSDEQPEFLQSCNIYIEASLKLLLHYLLKTWGLQVIGI